MGHHLRIRQGATNLVVTTRPFLEEVTHIVGTHDGDAFRYISRPQRRHGALMHQSGHMAVINDGVNPSRHPQAGLGPVSTSDMGHIRTEPFEQLGAHVVVEGAPFPG